MWRIVDTAAFLGLLVLTASVCAGCRGDDSTTPEARDGYPIRISGSDDVYPLLGAIAAHYEKDHPDETISFAPATHTRGGVAGISLGDSDIGLLSRPLSASERLSSATYLHLAHDVIAFVAHRNVQITGLTRRQLIDIYSGGIENWSEVGGRDEKINVLDRAEHTSLKIVLRQQLFGSELTITPNAIVLERPDDMIASLEMVENSIGYVSLGNALLSGLAIRPLAIDGERPSLDNFHYDRYPFTRPFGFLIGEQPSRSTMQFVEFLYSDEGRRTIAGCGFVPIVMDLSVAVLPEQDLLAQEQRYAPLVDYLSHRLGLQTTVKLRLLPNYGEVIDEFIDGEINAAFLGSLAFGLARAQAGVVPIARPEKNGVSQYRGLIVTRKDSGIRSWSDLRGRSFGLVDRATTAGHLYPLIFFREHGVTDIEAFLGPIVYTGSHDLLFMKVYDGELDAGAAKDLMLEEVARTRPEIKEGLRILSTSPPVPNNAFVMRGDLQFPCFRCHELVPDDSGGAQPGVPRAPEDLKQLISRLLLTLHETPEGQEVLRALGADRFVETTVDDLREVDRMIEQAGFDPKTYRP